MSVYTALQAATNRIRAAASNRDPNWYKLERQILLNNPKCCACGQPSVVGHRVIPFAVDRTKEMDPKNVAAMCARCHFCIGRGCNWRQFNKWFWAKVRGLVWVPTKQNAGD